jgi:plastocyanin
MYSATLVVTLSLLVLGCGGGDTAPASTGDSGGDAAPAQGPQGPMGTATIAGTINFTGTAPERVPLSLDRECASFNEAPLLSENVVVNDNGTLKWAFVYLKEGVAGTYSPPSEPVIFDQQGCRYVPHVIGMQTGQTIKILNSDPLLHNIHALPEVNRPFNFGMPKQGDERERSFRVAEIGLKIKCDVHPWMGAWAGVVDHPFFGVSGDDGTFTIQNVPAGDYVVEMWHETYGVQTMSVTVADGATATADFTVAAS